MSCTRVVYNSEVSSDLILPLLHTDTSESAESVDDESSPPITTVTIAIASGVGAFTCILLLTVICFCIMLRKRTLKKESKVSQHMTAGSEQEEQEDISLKGLHYEEIPVQHPHCEEVSVQNYHVYHTLEPPA